MEVPPKAEPDAETKKSTGSDVLALAKSSPSEIVTRRHLANTRLGTDRGIVRADVETTQDPTRPSIVTRRQVWLRRRRRKRILIALAVVLAFFPPMWAVYLIAWLIWRSRPPQKSMRRVRKAVNALEKNRTGIALQELQEAHLLDPTNNDALYWLGLLLSGQQRHAEAAEALSLVAERVPGLPEVETALVDACVATNDPDGAVYHAQRLLDAAPYSPETLLKLSDAYEAADRLDLAIQALEQAPLHKRTLSPALVQIHYRLGTLYERRGESERALHHYDRVYASNITYKDVRSRMKGLKAAGDE